MNITIYGAGCAKCQQTEELVRRVLAEVGMAEDVVKVGDLRAMAEAGIMLTPAVAVDGVVKVAGRVPKAEEVRQWITGE